ncbi:MAG: response regulator [Chlamydiae bacterium]|nr:response regulator [Chlamydiota bacterium]MBI3266537.1 response regulator [Chlamydiota bacterium]
MPFEKLRVGLSLKFILLTTLLIVLTSLTLGLFFLRSKERDYLEFLKSQGISLSRTLAFNSEYGVLTSNREVLSKLAQGVLQEADVSYCIIHDGSGQILVELYRSGPLKLNPPDWILGNALQLKLPGEEARSQDIPTENGTLKGFDAATLVKTRRLAKTHERVELLPGYLGILEQIKRRLKIEGQIIEEKIGTVRVGVSLININHAISKIKKAMGMITLVVAVVGMLITILLVQLIIQPIRRLVYGTRQIARGDLSYEVHVNSRDEIGELATSFNQMTIFLRRSHRQVEEYQKNLEQMVEERTHKLKETEAELIRSEKFAAIGELITGITHELNNKLTPILGYAQIFKTMKLDEKIARYMDIIEESALNAKRIVESLLKFSRNTPPQKAYCNLNDKMKETLSLIEPHVHKNNIQLKVELDPQLPRTMADPSLIGQAFLNILNNGWQAMEEKGGELGVKSYSKDGKIFFSVQDKGIGIAKEHLTKIFDPFFSTKEVGKGTGLGLSISYGILQGHEGNIHVESVLHQGSIFTIELPIKTLEHTSPEYVTSKQEETPVKKGKILIIEDEPSVQNLLVDALENHHDIATAMDGREGQRIIQRERFDLYVIDLRMPYMDGRELYAWIEKDFPREAKKVIFITGDTYDKKIQNFLSSVQQPQLNKPFQIVTLQSLVSQMLEKTADRT